MWWMEDEGPQFGPDFDPIVPAIWQALLRELSPAAEHFIVPQPLPLTRAAVLASPALSFLAKVGLMEAQVAGKIDLEQERYADLAKGMQTVLAEVEAVIVTGDSTAIAWEILCGMLNQFNPLLKGRRLPPEKYTTNALLAVMAQFTLHHWIKDRALPITSGEEVVMAALVEAQREANERLLAARRADGLPV